MVRILCESFKNLAIIGKYIPADFSKNSDQKISKSMAHIP